MHKGQVVKSRSRKISGELGMRHRLDFGLYPESSGKRLETFS